MKFTENCSLLKCKAATDKQVSGDKNMNRAQYRTQYSRKCDEQSSCD